MPISGKHRSPKSSTIARAVIVASAGGAVIALPLLGATGAGAAEQTAPATSKSAAATHATPAKPVAAEQTGTTTYSVVSGDYLSKIAAEHKLKGGWEKLYQDNRKVVGDDPSLIFPGMKLTLGGQASTTDAQTSAGATTPSKAPSTAPAKTESKAPAASNSSSSSDAQASNGTSAQAAQSTGSGYVHPVPGNHTTAYRASGASWSSGSHTGIDFPVSTGTSVKSISSGTVVTAGWGGAYGNEVVVKHADGHYSQYGHMSSLSVSAGQTVSAGQQVGLSGATGNATGPHLHFEIRTGPSYGSDIDPIAYLASHGIQV